MNISRYTGAGMLLCLLLCTSCAQLQPMAPPTETQLRMEGELLFLDGRYAEALREFQRIHEDNHLSAEDRKLALYGLACTQIFLARSEAELTEGLDNLEKWDEEKGDAPFRENRRLLVLALKQQSEVFARSNREQQKQVSRKDRLIASQKEKIVQLNGIIDRLQKQLEELEAIDERFQEKRKTL